MSDDESDDSFGDGDGEHGEGEDAPDKKTYVRQYACPRPEERESSLLTTYWSESTLSS